MRNAFINTLTDLAAKDKNIYLLTADTGFHVLDDFKKNFPNQFLNIGIAESSMIGIAAGLALSGKTVFVYGIVPFITMRCFEQIRNDLCYQNLNVKLIGIGAGLTYGAEGFSHHAIEDIAVMNSLTNMNVICPGDPIETRHALTRSMCLTGPCYIRLGKSSEPIVHTRDIESFKIGKGIILREGKDTAIISTGNMLPIAENTYQLLVARGYQPELISMHTVKPLDKELIKDISGRCNRIITIEEHSRIGGLGSAVADVIAEENLNVKLKKFALPDKYTDIAASQRYLREYHGLTAEKIVERLKTKD